MSVKADAFERSTASAHVGGSTAVRTFIVDGLTDADTYKRIGDAIGATGIPAVGTAHPDITGIHVEEISARMVGPSEAIVDVSYATLDLRDQLRLGIITKIVAWRSAEITRDTGLDINGSVMSIDYTGHIWTRDSQGLISETSTDYSMFNVARAELTEAIAVATYTKWVTSATAANITDYVGKVNDATWSGYAAGTWLCSSAIFEPESGGGFLTYELQYNPRTWQFEAHLIQTWGGFNVEPPEAVLNNGIEMFDVYDTAAFSGIGTI